MSGEYTQYRMLSRGRCSYLCVMASITLLLCSVSFSHCQFVDWETVNVIRQHWPHLGWPEATDANCPQSGFPGLICSADKTRVLQLTLLNRQLSGTIPPQLGNLTGLETLTLFNNRLSGTIPPELGNLARLETLGLFNNLLTGTIPPELGNLTRLRVLTLLNNRLSGTIPPELGNLARLQLLGLFNNLLTGTIPPELGNLARLEVLGLLNNRLSGTIPPQLGYLIRLTLLELSDNQLSGTIPPELGNLTSLTILDLSNNTLTGPVPLLGKLTILYFLRLQCNEDLDICSTDVTTNMFLLPGSCLLDLPVTQTGCRTNWAANGCDLGSYRCSAAPSAIPAIPMNPINSASSLIVSLGLVVATALAVVVF